MKTRYIGGFKVNDKAITGGNFIDTDKNKLARLLHKYAKSLVRPYHDGFWWVDRLGVNGRQVLFGNVKG